MIHVANPVPSARKDRKVTHEEQTKMVEDSIKVIVDAATGTKMKRLIVTSSLAAVMGGMFKRSLGIPWYSEKDFAPTEGADSYAVGKIL